MTPDTDRIDSLGDALHDEGLDLLACSLPANVLLLTGYWPVVGTALALVTRDRRTLLLAPQDEHDLAREGWADEILTFEPGSLKDLRDAEEAVREPLARVAQRIGPVRRIGYARGGMYEPSSYAALHIYGAATLDLLRAAFPDAELVPADERLAALKAIKTPLEIERIRLACLLAGQAFRAAADQIRTGEREVRVAAHFQMALSSVGEETPLSAGEEGSDFGRADSRLGSRTAFQDRPQRRVGGFAYCMSGPNSAQAFGAYARSRYRPVQSGEPILIHANSYADGYWTDITRTFFLGSLSPRFHDLYEAVYEARAAAFDALRIGAPASGVDQAARRVLERRGLGPAFRHSTGHGVGFSAINHNARPRLHPQSPETLRPGMVFNVEPAVYLDGVGGVRHCDVVAIGPRGVELLTPFQTTAAELIRPDEIGRT